MTPSNIMESQASGSGSAPKNKRPKLNFSQVHREFEQIEVFNARKDKNVPGSKCKQCGQKFLDRNSTNLTTLSRSLLTPMVDLTLPAARDLQLRP